MKQQITGTAAGVPFVATPPDTERANAPIVIGWHPMDPPHTEAAFAAALPLEGLDAWRVYLGLPMYGSRTPAGGPEEVMRLAFEDAVMNLQGPVTAQATDEFPAAYAALQEQLGLGAGPIGVFGGSLGAAIALQVLTEGLVDVQAAVVFSPVVQLRAAVEATARSYDITYPWHDAADAVAARLDFVARSDEIAKRSQPAILAIVGGDDDVEGFMRPAQQLHQALAAAYDDSARVGLHVVPGMGHAIAEEPGVEPAPQSPQALTVDGLAVDWFRRQLPAVAG